MLGLLKLDNPIQHYAWGSKTALARLQGRPPAAEPEAELWLGAHPQTPSAVTVAGRRVSLERLIAERPAAALGAVAQRFGGALPFLLKVLAVGEPLSIQAHPTRQQAAAGFAREQAAGLAVDAPQRSYRDRNHKPEVVVALEPYALLSGFRSYAAVARRLQALPAPELRAAVARLSAAPGPDALRALVAAALRLDAAQRAALVAQAVRSAAGQTDSAAAGWVRRLAEQYPEDAGALSPWLLNLVRLAPGEGAFTGAGTLHATLRGTGVELQANSDNVLRGGLTAKHVDVAELLRVAKFAPEPPAVLRPPPGANGERHYPTPAAEFALSSVALGELPPGTAFAATVSGPEILLLVHGSATLRDSAQREIHCRPGESVFVPAAAGSYSANGTALLFRARVPDA